MPCAPHPFTRWISTYPIDNVILVHFQLRQIRMERFIGYIAKELDDVMEHGDQDIVISFREVRYLSGGLLLRLHRLRQKLEKTQRKMVLCAMDEACLGALRLAKAENEFTVCADELAAIQTIQA